MADDDWKPLFERLRRAQETLDPRIVRRRLRTTNAHDAAFAKLSAIPDLRHLYEAAGDRCMIDRYWELLAPEHNVLALGKRGG